MDHFATATLQRYLNGGASTVEAVQIDGHLAGCSRCSDLLARLAAEDAALAEGLALTAPETDWIAAQDLTESVLRQITSRPRADLAAALVAVLLLGAVGSWLAYGVIGRLLDDLLFSSGPVGFAIDVTRALLPILWRGALYVADGGLLARIWPALAAGGLFWLRSLRTKGALHHA